MAHQGAACDATIRRTGIGLLVFNGDIFVCRFRVSRQMAQDGVVTGVRCRSVQLPVCDVVVPPVIVIAFFLANIFIVD